VSVAGDNFPSFHLSTPPFLPPLFYFAVHSSVSLSKGGSLAVMWKTPAASGIVSYGALGHMPP